MKTSSYSLVAALVSAIGLQQSQCYAAENDQPYFRKALELPADPQVLAQRDVVVVPVTVVVGPDGKPTTLSETKTTTPEATPTAKSSEDGLLELLDDTLGITVGLDGVVADPQPTPVEPLTASSSSNTKLTDGITFSSGVGTAGTTTITSATSAAETSSVDPGLSLVVPTLPGFPDFNEAQSSSSSATETPTQSLSSMSLSPSSSSSMPSSSPSVIVPAPLPAPGNSTSVSSEVVLPSWTSAEATASDSLSFDLPTLTMPSLTMPSLTVPMPTSSFPSASISQPSFSSNTTAPPATSGSSFPTSSPSSIPIPSSIPSSIPSGVFPSDSWRLTGVLPTKTSSSAVISTSEPATTTKATTTKATTTSKATSTSIYTEPEEPTVIDAPAPPLSTDTKTTMVVPTQIVFQPPPTLNPSPTTESVDHTPPPVPGSISPPDGGFAIPSNSRLIQLGFKEELNYDFVAKRVAAIQQFFGFVPQGVSYALEIELPEVYMHKLAPYESNRGYRATLAMMYIPQDLVDKLEAQLFSPASLLYNHPNPPINTMMSMIDPTIPLIPGQQPQNSVPGNDDSGAPGGTGDDDDDGKDGDGNNNEGDGSNKSSGVQASAVGIGLGVVGGAALYGAAMFFVARRYRRKRRMHRRTSSLTSGLGDDQSSRVPSPSDGMLAGGYRDSHGSGGAGSARTAMISAPVMSENSLGWN